MFAAGPETLLQKFAAVLANDGAKTSMLPSGPRRPVVWEGSGWGDPEPDIAVVDLGESWVVARRFVVDAVRLPRSAGHG